MSKYIKEDYSLDVVLDSAVTKYDIEFGPYKITKEMMRKKQKMIFLLSERAQLLLMEGFICLLRKAP